MLHSSERRDALWICGAEWARPSAESRRADMRMALLFVQVAHLWLAVQQQRLYGMQPGQAMRILQVVLCQSMKAHTMAQLLMANLYQTEGLRNCGKRLRDLTVC